jgi:hypothetical protein
MTTPPHTTTMILTTSQRKRRRQRQWAVSVFAITTVLLFADQNLMAPNLTAIAHDFNFTNEQRDQKLGGDIALAFFMLGAPASFVVGALGDTHNRSLLFAVTVGLGEGACLATFWTQSYTWLYACRAITGFALGGALPLIYSILGDLYSAQDRHVVNAVVGIGTGVGISLGQGVAGFLGPWLGWRWPFLVIALPALVCALLVFLTVQDPERGGMEAAVLQYRHQHHYHHHHDDNNDDDENNEADAPYSDSETPHNNTDATSATGTAADAVEMMPLHYHETTFKPFPDATEEVFTEEDYHHQNHDHDDTTTDVVRASTSTVGMSIYWRTFASLLQTPTVVLSLLQGAPGCVPWGIVNSFLNDYLSENRGLSVEVRNTA